MIQVESLLDQQFELAIFSKIQRPNFKIRRNEKDSKRWNPNGRLRRCSDSAGIYEGLSWGEPICPQALSEQDVGNSATSNWDPQKVAFYIEFGKFGWISSSFTRFSPFAPVCWWLTRLEAGGAETSSIKMSCLNSHNFKKFKKVTTSCVTSRRCQKNAKKAQCNRRKSAKRVKNLKVT